jgi:hypothetical protein
MDSMLETCRRSAERDAGDEAAAAVDPSLSARTRPEAATIVTVN